MADCKATTQFLFHLFQMLLIGNCLAIQVVQRQSYADLESLFIKLDVKGLNFQADLDFSEAFQGKLSFEFSSLLLLKPLDMLLFSEPILHSLHPICRRSYQIPVPIGVMG